MISEIQNMDRTLIILQEGRAITEQEKRFNLLKSEQEEEENPCEHCASPDYIDDTSSFQEAKSSPYIRQNDLSTGQIMFQSQADLFQETREIKDITRTCLFCGVITKDRVYGQYIEKKIGVQNFSNSTKTTVSFSYEGINSTENDTLIYSLDASIKVRK